MKNIASYLHLLLCKKKHSSNVDINNPDPNKCLWYIEEQFDVCWEEACHKKWLAMGQNITMLAGLDEEKMYTLIQKIVRVLQEIKKLKADYPTVQEFIVDLLIASIKD